MDNSRICIAAHDELYVLDLNKVVYFQADDHYTHVYYYADKPFMVPFGLSRIQAAILDAGEPANYVVRLGRKHIVNTRRIFRISTIKETLYLNDDAGSRISIHVPKAALRPLITLMRPRTSTTDGTT
ncbi:MAG: LytTR family transcriptional regulator [Bacteroidaceae bacterium]|nr:LytTR family transcriptional regulator [Bacteroidaceae bacterium]